MFTPEDEIDMLHEDLGRARRALESLLRAPYEKRWNGSAAEYDERVRCAQENVRELERELREARMAEQAALDAQEDAA